MSLWLIRSSFYGEFESKFLEGNWVYMTWDHLGNDLKAELPMKRIWTVAVQKDSIA